MTTTAITMMTMQPYFIDLLMFSHFSMSEIEVCLIPNTTLQLLLACNKVKFFQVGFGSF